MPTMPTWLACKPPMQQWLTPILISKKPACVLPATREPDIMNWEARYLPPDPTPWRGRDDAPAGSCFFQRVALVNLLSEQLSRTAEPAFAIIGFKSDEGA